MRHELHEHLPALDRATIQLGAADDAPAGHAPHARHHHAFAPFRVDTPLTSGMLAIVDTPGGQRMRLTVVEHANDLKAVVRIERPGGRSETIELLPVPQDHHVFMSKVALEEPHIFDAVLELSKGAQRVRLPFHVAEPH